MRWTMKDEQRDEMAERVVSRFLLLPLTFGKETRWLTRVCITQRWAHLDGFKDCWVDWKWAD